MTDVIFIAACIVGFVAAWVAALEPGQLFQHLGEVFSRWKKAIPEDENGYTERHSWAELWSCPYCLAWWIGIVVGAVLVYFGNWYGIGLGPLCWLMTELKDRH